LASEDEEEEEKADESVVKYRFVCLIVFNIYWVAYIQMRNEMNFEKKNERTQKKKRNTIFCCWSI